MGPDADEIDEDEAALRLDEYLIPVFEGPKAWRTLHIMKGVKAQEHAKQSRHIQRRR
jgi:hypothetical protein